MEESRPKAILIGRMTPRMVLVLLRLAIGVCTVGAVVSHGTPHWTSFSWDCVSARGCAAKPDIAEAKAEKALADTKAKESSQKAKIAALQAESASTLEEVQRAEETLQRHKYQGLAATSLGSTLSVLNKDGTGYDANSDPGRKARCSEVGCSTISESACLQEAETQHGATVTSFSSGSSANLPPYCTLEVDTGIAHYNTNTSSTNTDFAGYLPICPGGAIPGELDCSPSTSPKWEATGRRPSAGFIKNCPDGRINPRGFYEMWYGDAGPQSGCTTWDSDALLPSYGSCLNLKELTDVSNTSKSYVCSKMQAGHVHYSDSSMGYCVAKRILCTELSSGGFQCSTYKLGICMQNVGVNLWRSNADYDKAVMKQWVQAALTIVENNGGEIPAANQCTGGNIINGNDSRDLVNRFIAAA